MSDAYARFYALWGSDYHTPVRPTPDELGTVERELGFHFPQAYLNALGTHGAFSTVGALLDIIVDRNIPMRDLSELFVPNEIRETMLGWQEAGLPKGLVTIAKDCGGSALMKMTARRHAFPMRRYTTGTMTSMKSTMRPKASRYGSAGTTNLTNDGGSGASFRQMSNVSFLFPCLMKLWLYLRIAVEENGFVAFSPSARRRSNPLPGANRSASTNCAVSASTMVEPVAASR